MDPRASGSDYSHETFFGYIKNPSDALIIIECCIQRHLKPFDRPPSDMLHLPIRSGSVIVLSDSANGVKRWRDGEKWSPSRAYGPFLLYKQAEYAINDTQKKPYTKTSNLPTPQIPIKSMKNNQTRRNGLTKRTLTLFGSDGNRHRVISYYNQQDVLDLHNRLARNERPWDETVFKLPLEDPHISMRVNTESPAFKKLLAKSIPAEFMDWTEHTDIRASGHPEVESSDSQQTKPKPTVSTAPFTEYSHMSLPPILDKRQITRITDKPSLPKLREVLPSQFLDNQWCHTASNYHQVPGYPMWHPYYYHHIPASAESYQHASQWHSYGYFPHPY
ncbi:hypothetical protein HDU79_001584 [Rhizoclosmatium sp. JEL0117]|nr:hypothetical protein HDU79_001584 [Rhizoclosmatium sp. JEL0117]